MISDSERREVAAKLRKITGNDDGEVYVYDIMLALGLESGKAVYWTEEEFVRYLADLIDRPTCRLRPKELFSPWGICSECGAFVDKISAVSDGNRYIDVGFCPHCGCEVVS